MNYLNEIPNIETSKQIQFILNKVENVTKSKICYVLSEDSEIDGEFSSFPESLKVVIGSCRGTILSLENGKIIFYEGESPNDRYLGVVERGRVSNGAFEAF